MVSFGGTKRYQGAFSGTGSALYLDLGGCYMGKKLIFVNFTILCLIILSWSNSMLIKKSLL